MQTAMVADSQWHHGVNIDIYIEDQPLTRGTVIQETADLYWQTGAMVPIDDYSRNGFGDTHSLVLIVDFINVQNVLLRLASEATQAEGAWINGAVPERHPSNDYSRSQTA